MNTPNEPTRDEAGAPAPEGGRPRTKTPTRRMVVGIAAGLAAAVGTGFAVQSVQAAQVDDMPAGAQLPWDDSTSANPDEGREFGRPHDRRESMRDRIRDRVQDRMRAEGRDGVQEGPRGDRPFERMGARGLIGPRELLAVAAEELGVTIEELVDGVKSGMSIADIAGEKNVSIQDVIDALVDVIVEDATERITDLVNRSIDLPGSDTPNS